jgi:hypothetical protein
MAHVRLWCLALSALAALGATGCATATAPARPDRPARGLGLVEIESSPAADAVVVRPVKAPGAADEPRAAPGTPARFELPPGSYHVELDRDGGRYAYDLDVDVRELERRHLAVQLRAAGAERRQATFFTAVGAAAAGSLAVACATHRGSQACAASIGVAALTGIVAGAAIYAWTHSGRVEADEVTVFERPPPPPPPVRPPPPPPARPPAKPRGR